MYWVRSRHKLRTLLTLLLFGIVILPVFPESFWNRMRTIAPEQHELDESARGRVHFWNVAVLMAARNPLVGVGHNGFQAAYNEYDTSDGSFGSQRSVHSMWFGIVSELGYPGLLIFLLIFVRCLVACCRVRRKCSTHSMEPFLGACAIGVETGLIAAAAGGTFLTFQYIEILWHFFGLSIVMEKIAVSELERAQAC
jgi:O-antigen ligase